MQSSRFEDVWVIREVHSFEVVEQRGFARGGEFKEFQVKLRVAIEMRENAENRRPYGFEGREFFCAAHLLYPDFM